MIINIGYTPSWVIAVKSDGEWSQLERESADTSLKVTGQLVGWSSAVVSLTNRESGKRRLFFLAPSDDTRELEIEGYALEGAFEIASKERNPKKASDRWEALELAELR